MPAGRHAWAGDGRSDERFRTRGAVGGGSRTSSRAGDGGRGHPLPQCYLAGRGPLPRALRTARSRFLSKCASQVSAHRVEISLVASQFSVHVAKENLKFSAAHFIAYRGFREALHGHNYQVGVRVEGDLSGTGYVVDFGLIKKLTKEIVDRIDEHTIIPAQSDCLVIEQIADGRVRVRYENDEFVFPASDVFLAPIVHSSAEELARFLWDELHAALQARGALAGVGTLEISVAEGPGQAAIFRKQTGSPG